MLMFFLEILCDLLDMLNHTDRIACMPSDVPTEPTGTNIKSATVSDIKDCAKAHEKIENSNCKKLTPFVSYTDYVNEQNGRKTTAGQVHIPYNEIQACVTEKILIKK